MRSAILQDPRWAGPTYLATRLCWAAASTLQSQGAALSLHSRGGFCVPLGASSGAAAHAEQLQFTTGEGPCWQAEVTGQPVVATQEFMTGTWPFFVDHLVARTPFRSVVAVAIPGVGVMDMHFTSPAGCLGVRLDDVRHIVEQITRTLVDPRQTPVLEHCIRAAERRHQVNIAVGMVAQALKFTIDDAMAVLRAHAVANDLSLDDLAAAVVDGSVPTSALMGA